MNKSINPLVSISCITYNHVAYINKTIEGFLMQKTDFNFEVLIHDDASIDGTIEIIKEYEKKHPDIIKPIYEEENQWVKGRKGSATFNFPRAKGKYIAMCEGDDYWIDPFKLQKQIDFLENHDNYVICGTAFIDSEGGKHQTSRGNPTVKQKEINSQNQYGTATVVFRNILDYKDKSCEGYIFGDYPLWLNLHKKGIGYILPDITAYYRIHGGGVYSKKNDEEKHKKLISFLHHYLERNPKYPKSGRIKKQIVSQSIKLGISSQNKDNVAFAYKTLIKLGFHINLKQFKSVASVIKKHKKLK